MNSDAIARSRLDSIIEGFPGRRIMVLGDLILDEFIWGRVDRISPEAPVPVVQVTHEYECLGGAANVARNLVALGASVQLVGVVGADIPGNRFLRLAAASGIGVDGVVVEKERRTTCKSRVIAHHQQVCRFDREDPVQPGSETQCRIADYVLKGVSEVDAVTVSDYAKGVVRSDLVVALADCCRERKRFLAIDPKARDFRNYRGASVVTPNRKEAELAAGFSIDDDASAESAARLLQRQAESDAILITRGEEGMSLLDQGRFLNFPAVAREVFDVTGAGDTVIAVLTLAVASGASIAEATSLANYSAGIVVGKLGTATLSVTELRASVGLG